VKRLAEFVKAARLGSQRQSVVRPYRLGPQEAPHPILDGEVPGAQCRRHHGPVQLFELSTVGALRILEEDHAATGPGRAEEDSPFWGMARGRDPRIRRRHGRLRPVRGPFMALTL
jgi:hypothetical protein